MRDVLLRAANTLVALAALFLLAPAMLVIALLIKLDSPGPAIYRQWRVGLDRRRPDPVGAPGSRRGIDFGGRPFTLYKFRTMRRDAEALSGPVWTTRGDARVTRVGRVLRRFGLDELPQFWNVVKGDMSIVGPRPERPHFVLRLREEIADYPARHRVKPGITGWAQVHVGSDHSIDDVREKLGYDLEYLRRRSLWLDLQIMIRTVPVMFEPAAGPRKRGDTLESQRSDELDGNTPGALSDPLWPSGNR